MQARFWGETIEYNKVSYIALAVGVWTYNFHVPVFRQFVNHHN